MFIRHVFDENAKASKKTTLKSERPPPKPERPPRGGKGMCFIAIINVEFMLVHCDYRKRKRKVQQCQKPMGQEPMDQEQVARPKGFLVR